MDKFRAAHFSRLRLSPRHSAAKIPRDITELPNLKNPKLVFFPCLPPYKPIDDFITLNRLLEGDKEDIPAEVRKRNRDFRDDFAADLDHLRSVKLFEEEKPKYQNDVPVFGSVKEGEKVDVISMLSSTSNNGRDYLVRNDGERVLVETLRGKYILVCCFFVPMLAESYYAYKCLNIIAAYTHLILERRDDIQMVMVAKMRRDWADDEPDFQHFFSGFPFHCLAIPFWDSQSRDCVAKSLGFHHSWPTTLVVDPEQTVLQTGSSMDTLFERHGALTFPFTAERIYSLSKEDRELSSRINNMNRGPENTLPTLDQLLCLNTSDYLCSSDEKNGCMSVLDLSNKVVGLYLCYDGRYLATINFFHQKCKAKGLEFEILLVYMPFVGPVKWLQTRVNEALVKHEISWWLLPFNDKVSRRLSRFSSYGRNDKMIILGPNSSFAEILGLEVMCCCGIRGYPFARESIVDRKFAKLRSLTLESVFEEHNYVLDKDGDRVPVSELLGRNIILYLDYLDPPLSGDVYDQLVNWYPKLKAKDPEFEVVFISYDAPGGGKVHERYYKMQWLSVPFPSGHSEYYVNINQLFLEWEDKYPKLIAFGKDGLLRSRCAQEHLRLDGIDAFPFEGYLRQEMFPDFNELNHFVF